MNLATPILICDETEEFRSFVRDMLTKNGFFHVIEASNAQDAMKSLENRDHYLVLVEAKAFTTGLYQELKKQKNFIVFAEGQDELTATLAAQIGVGHIMTYPFHSRKLISKISSML